jgi:nicotinamide-nucleotide amidase
MSIVPPTACNEEECVFTQALIDDAARLLVTLRERRMLLVTVESCTGGLLAGLLTEIPGSSEVIERGFVAYSNAAKTAMVGVSAELIATNGAVSEPVARAMAEGALANSKAQMAIADTGFAGPGGGTIAKPVGLVHLAVARIRGATLHRQCQFGDIGRRPVRLATIASALELAHHALGGMPVALRLG